MLNSIDYDRKMNSLHWTMFMTTIPITNYYPVELQDWNIA